MWQLGGQEPSICAELLRHGSGRVRIVCGCPGVWLGAEVEHWPVWSAVTELSQQIPPMKWEPCAVAFAPLLSLAEGNMFKNVSFHVDERIDERANFIGSGCLISLIQ